MTCRGLLLAAASFVACTLLPMCPAKAETLHSAVQYTLETNPDVLISIKERLQANQQLKEAQAGFFPTLDLDGETGRERSKNFSTRGRFVSLNRRNANLTAKENVFNGYATYFNVKSDLALMSSAAYVVNDTSQNTALAVTEVYLNVLRTRQLVAISRSNVKVHRKITRIIRKRVKKGLSRQSELEQSEGRLALARSNLYNEMKAYQDAIAEYIDVIGKPPRGLALPPNMVSRRIHLSQQAAIEKAIANNPALISAHYNLSAAVAAHKAAYSADYPNVDLVLSSTRGRNLNGIISDNFDDSAFVQVTFNLFRGGADMARQKKTAYEKEEAFEKIHKAERNVIKNTSFAWNDLKTAIDRLSTLKIHMVKSKFVVNAYRKQYTAGKRTLVDVLNSEAEYFSSRRSYVDGRFSIILSKYRLLTQMGMLLQKFNIPLPEAADAQYHTYYDYHRYRARKYITDTPPVLPSPHDTKPATMKRHKTTIYKTSLSVAKTKPPHTNKKRRHPTHAQSVLRHAHPAKLTTREKIKLSAFIRKYIIPTSPVLPSPYYTKPTNMKRHKTAIHKTIKKKSMRPVPVQSVLPRTQLAEPTAIQKIKLSAMLRKYITATPLILPSPHYTKLTNMKRHKTAIHKTSLSVAKTKVSHTKKIRSIHSATPTAIQQKKLSAIIQEITKKTPAPLRTHPKKIAPPFKKKSRPSAHIYSFQAASKKSDISIRSFELPTH